MRKFLAVLDARNKEFLRDRSALAWNLVFPILVILGFSFAFSGQSQDVFKVGLIKDPSVPSQITEFLKTDYIQFVDQNNLDAALGKLRRHQIDMIVSDTASYWINSTSPKGYLLEKILKGTVSDSSSRSNSLSKQTVQGKEIRYVDWLVSGLLGMNIMFSALFGVGYTIVRYRKNGVLKRLKATPLGAFEFLCAQVFSRLILLVGTSVVVFYGCHLLIKFQVIGTYWNLFLVLTLGSICLISLGLLIASRIASEEFAGGVLNLISWPMMFLSGVWFSLEGAHPIVQSAAQAFPLTHVIGASRAIMTEGADLSQVGPHLLVLTCMSVVFLLVGALTFKWE